MNSNLHNLHPYPFERLNNLLEDVTGNTDNHPIAFSLGEPKHAPPAFIVEFLAQEQSITTSLGTYPATKGVPELRSTIADWLTVRFQLPTGFVDPEANVLPVSGTREALFSFAQAVVSTDANRAKPLVLMPNPFYQIYEGAALIAGAIPVYIPCNEDNGFLPDFSEITDDTWRQCQLLYLCTPGNPTGAVMSEALLVELIHKSQEFDFVIASDECYSEIYFDEDQPPAGLLQASISAGNTSFQRCVVFNSLSKRSNLPGLRSGLVAGDPDLIKRYLLYRTYHGAAMPLISQLASQLAWQDETHVIANRAIYRQKMAQVLPVLSDVLPITAPAAGFYLWPRLAYSDERFTVDLLQKTNVKVLPGSYLARTVNSLNPGENRVRMALVATLQDCIEAAERIAHFIRQG